MTKAHKATSQEQFLVRRKLTVAGLAESQWEKLIQELNHHPCVDFAECKSKDRLLATFDGTHFSIDELIDFVGAHGGHLNSGWWERQKIGWYQFTEENIRANVKHEPFCCSKIPPLKK